MGRSHHIKFSVSLLYSFSSDNLFIFLLFGGGVGVEYTRTVHMTVGTLSEAISSLGCKRNSSSGSMFIKQLTEPQLLTCSRKWNSRDIATCYKRTKYGCQYLNHASGVSYFFWECMLVAASDYCFFLSESCGLGSFLWNVRPVLEDYAGCPHQNMNGLYHLENIACKA